MLDNWETYPLGDIYEFRSGLSKPSSEFGSGYPFLSFKDVFQNIFLPSRLTELVKSSESERESCSIKRGDIFLTRTSETAEELGLSSVALKDYPEATFNGFTKRLRPKSQRKVVPEYAGFYFRSAMFRRQLIAMSSLSTRASLNNEMLNRLTIVLPPTEVQQVIGYILKTLEDKIELNRRMSATLEAIARAIFKSWLVDFDPVYAKLGGRDPGLPPHIADLFPDRLVDSELGAIPEWWDIIPVGDAVEAVGGATPYTKNPAFWEGGDIYWATPKDLSGLDAPILVDTSRKITEEGLSTISSGLLPSGTVLLSSRAPVGYLAISTVPTAINQGFIAMICNGPISNYFMLNWSHFNMDEIKQRASSSEKRRPSSERTSGPPPPTNSSTSSNM